MLSAVTYILLILSPDQEKEGQRMSYLLVERLSCSTGSLFSDDEENVTVVRPNTTDFVFQ